MLGKDTAWHISSAGRNTEDLAQVGPQIKTHILELELAQQTGMNTRTRCKLLSIQTASELEIKATEKLLNNNSPNTISNA